MNLATETMNKMYKMLSKSDSKLKEMGKEPYGQRKLSEREQYQKYKELTPEKLIDTLAGLDSKGFKQFNEWLYRMEQKEKEYGY